jgi:hypothetical protein
MTPEEQSRAFDQDHRRGGDHTRIIPTEDDDLINELLESDAAFWALVARSKARPRKPFAIDSDSPNGGNAGG